MKGLPNYKAGQNIVKNEGERLASGATAEVWKFYLPVIKAFCMEERELAEGRDQPSTEDQ